MQTKIEDYLRLCAPFVWVVVPYEKRAWVATRDGARPVRDGVLRTAAPEIAVPLAEVFD